VESVKKISTPTVESGFFKDYQPREPFNSRSPVSRNKLSFRHYRGQASQTQRLKSQRSALSGFEYQINDAIAIQAVLETNERPFPIYPKEWRQTGLATKYTQKNGWQAIPTPLIMLQKVQKRKEILHAYERRSRQEEVIDVESILRIRVPHIGRRCCTTRQLLSVSINVSVQI
jgi:hypothetical protein